MVQKSKIYLGENELKITQKAVSGEFVKIDDEKYYKISNYDKMNPFFMSLVSPTDHWMFIWSNGPLSAGRRNPDNALFPYYTDDKIRDYSDITGSKTIIFIQMNERKYLWEPFADKYTGVYEIVRNCYKNIYGNRLIFEEVNKDLQVTFQYSWTTSEKFGFVKHSKLINNNKNSVKVELLDGIQNIMPYGIQQRFQNEYSTLADGYKKNELVPETNLGIYTLSSIPVDKAEPSESLQATTVWSAGLKADKILISSRQLESFREGEEISQKTDVRAARGAYFIYSRFLLSEKKEKNWIIVAEINQDAADVAQINHQLKSSNNLVTDLEQDIKEATEKLVRLVASADGLQKTHDQLSTARHFSNTLFNIMRGGIFYDNYTIKKMDFAGFIHKANVAVYKKNAEFLKALPETLSYGELIDKAEVLDHTGLLKLCYEYLPLTFSRRHGDPSRPWNKFSIEVKDENGDDSLNYQGNWRDIFQNWEALALSYPEFIESMITKFVNASTVDGYNPYRVTKEGFDWEVADPDDPWSYIGYWGDHQIVYLLKLLEISHQYHPGKLQKLLLKPIFTYANVPYRIRDYAEILRDPHNTVDFVPELNEAIDQRVKKMGNDGKLVMDAKEHVYQVNLSEKILVPILAKLSNFIPEAGIWMNTQRPEWNDANNALVGYGVSMVTLYYLRKHLEFCLELFNSLDTESIAISGEVSDWLLEILQTLSESQQLLKNRISNTDRKKILDNLEMAAEKYRQQVYSEGFSKTVQNIETSQITGLFTIALNFLNHTIDANKRDDGLYHAYNLMSVKGDKIEIEYLYKMLEGQVAVLSSGYLSVKESVSVLKALRNSDLYREDQNTYLLYPDRDLARFTEKNNIPAKQAKESPVMQKMRKNNDRRIILEDIYGNLHFNGDFRNAWELERALDNLTDQYDITATDKSQILNIFESMFNHKAFTGRSGTFFKYEGLGSTYWHMVSKLLLVTGDTYYQAIHEHTDEQLLDNLKTVYYDIRAGIGMEKSPELYGAFPTDAYSHTPSYIGVQQPGLTGQVKEDFISRFNELGVRVSKGEIRFDPKLLREMEFLSEPEEFIYYDIRNMKKAINLKAGTLGFTIAQTPVIYHQESKDELIVVWENGETETFTEPVLVNRIAQKIFRRTGEILKIHLNLHCS
ncbi:MAG: hypothetical protein ACLFQM_07080 [Fidelibacterota bacterium]